jgi:hypothetical protein
LWLKVVKSAHIDSPPPLSVFQQLVSEQVLQETVNHWKEIMEYTKIGAPSLMEKTMPFGVKG